MLHDLLKESLRRNKLGPRTVGTLDRDPAATGELLGTKLEWMKIPSQRGSLKPPAAKQRPGYSRGSSLKDFMLRPQTKERPRHPEVGLAFSQSRLPPAGSGARVDPSISWKPAASSCSSRPRKVRSRRDWRRRSDWDAALAIHQELVELTLTRLNSISCVELKVTPDDALAEVAPWIRAGWTLSPQGDGDLGDRLARGFESAFAGRPGRWVALGTDCPEITPQDVESLGIDWRPRMWSSDQPSMAAIG